MNTLFVSVTICLIGFTFGDDLKAKKPTLTACKVGLKNFVKFTCDVGEGLPEAAVVVLKNGALDATADKINDAVADVYKDATSAAFTAYISKPANNKAFTCRLNIDASNGDENKMSKVSDPLKIADPTKLAECSSSAPRLVGSLSAALLCIMAIFIKS